MASSLSAASRPDDAAKVTAYVTAVEGKATKLQNLRQLSSFGYETYAHGSVMEQIRQYAAVFSLTAAGAPPEAQITAVLDHVLTRRCGAPDDLTMLSRQLQVALAAGADGLPPTHGDDETRADAINQLIRGLTNSSDLRTAFGYGARDDDAPIYTDPWWRGGPSDPGSTTPDWHYHPPPLLLLLWEVLERLGDGPRWSHGDLTYAINPRRCNLPGPTVVEAVTAAVRMWEAVAPEHCFRFQVSSYREADIRFEFRGNEYPPFAGRKGWLTAANAPRASGGEVTFNETMTWTQRDLFQVALHEFGHVLGLGHTLSDPSTVMGAVRSGAETVDDATVARLRRLYDAEWIAGFTQHTPLAVLTRNPNRMDIFGVSRDGGVYSAFWHGDWHDWYLVGTAEFAQGTPIAALSRNPDQMDLFAVRPDGGVYSAFWHGDWHDWYKLLGLTRFAGHHD
jgi:Matrixin